MRRGNRICWSLMCSRKSNAPNYTANLRYTDIISRMISSGSGDSSAISGGLVYCDFIGRTPTVGHKGPLMSRLHCIAIGL